MNYAISYNENKITKLTMSRRITKSNSTRSTRNGPPIVVPDRPDGCESTACYIAQTFYNSCHHEITKISSRNALRKFFINSQKFWMPPELTQRNEYRHFDQVLYALVNDGGVCRVKKADDGSHNVLWGKNDFRRHRNQPRKRINVPNMAEISPILDDASTNVVYDLSEDVGPPLTMKDLQVEEGEEPYTPPDSPLHTQYRDVEPDYRGAECSPLSVTQRIY